MPFVATWVDLEIIIPSEVKSEKERQTPYDITYMWKLKYDIGLPWESGGKSLPANAGGTGLIPSLGRFHVPRGN